MPFASRRVFDVALLARLSTDGKCLHGRCSDLPKIQTTLNRGISTDSFRLYTEIRPNSIITSFVAFRGSGETYPEGANATRICRREILSVARANVSPELLGVAQRHLAVGQYHKKKSANLDRQVVQSV